MYTPFVALVFCAIANPETAAAAPNPSNSRFIRIAKNDRELTDVAFRLQIIDSVDQIENIYWDLVYAYENVRVQNEGPVRFTVAQQVLTLQQLRLKGEDTDLSAHGTVQLTGPKTLDLRADGRLNMKLIEGFSPELTSSGIVTAALSASPGVILFGVMIAHSAMTNARDSFAASPSWLITVMLDFLPNGGFVNT